MIFLNGVIVMQIGGEKMNLKDILNITEMGTRVKVEISPKTLWADEEHEIVVDNKFLYDCFNDLEKYFDYLVVGITVFATDVLTLVIYKREKCISV